MTMSHSLDRANSRGACLRVAARCPYRLVRTTCMTCPRSDGNSCSLRAALEKQSIEKQQDHGAHDRHDPPRHIILTRKNPTDPGPYQCTSDTEQNRNDATTGIFSRHQQLCDRADNKTNKN